MYDNYSNKLEWGVVQQREREREREREGGREKSWTNTKILSLDPISLSEENIPQGTGRNS